MATERKAEVEWIGDLMGGEGKLVSTTSGLLPELELTWDARLDEDSGLVSPEEFLAAGLASCYAMSLTHTLVGGGWEPEELKVAASLNFEPGVGITSGKISVEATVEGIEDAKLWERAELARQNCPVVKALAAVDIELDLPGVERPVEEQLEPDFVEE
jgi:osmotically inducible protein OsmC